MNLAETSFESGEMIAGRYQVIKQHCETALWEGYCTTDQKGLSQPIHYGASERRDIEQVGPEVLVKLVRRALIPTQAMRAQLVRELEPLIGLAHPTILRLIDVKVLNRPETVMLCEAMVKDQPLGQPIGHLLRRRYFTLSEVQSIVTELARALTYLHSKGRCHGDLRLETVHWWRTGVTLGDIGLGAALTRSLYLTAVGNVLQLELLAPEVRSGERPDVRSDVFGLAALYRHLLSLGRKGSWHTLLTEKPVMGYVIERATHKDPAQRYQSVEALISDMQAVEQTGKRSPHP